MPVPVPFDPRKARIIYRRRLPHWRQPGAAYFVTFRLADAMPQAIVNRWLEDDRRWLVEHPGPLTIQQRFERVRRYGRKLMKYLDAGHGECLLSSEAARKIVVDALKYFDEQRYLLGTYAIMLNHVHALVMPLGDEELTDIVASWTRFSAVRINKLADRSGRLWQEEPFDHIVRHQAAYRRFEEYIRRNPENAPTGCAEVGCGKLTW